MDVSLWSGRFALRNTLDFWLRATRDTEAAKRFFQKALIASHTVTPRVINGDKNAAYPKAPKELKAEGRVPESCDLRQVTYLNHRIEQDRRFIKRLAKPGMRFFSFATAERPLQGDEIMNMVRKGQNRGVGKGDLLSQAAFSSHLLGVAA